MENRIQDFEAQNDSSRRDPEKKSCTDLNVTRYTPCFPNEMFSWSNPSTIPKCALLCVCYPSLKLCACLTSLRCCLHVRVLDQLNRMPTVWTYVLLTSSSRYGVFLMMDSEGCLTYFNMLFGWVSRFRWWKWYISYIASKLFAPISPYLRLPRSFIFIIKNSSLICPFETFTEFKDTLNMISLDDDTKLCILLTLLSYYSRYHSTWKMQHAWSCTVAL